MPYTSARELKEDVLFRASEPTTGISDWETKVIDYLNRYYNTLCTGDSEFLPEYLDDWWWMRRQNTLLFEPAYVTGSVALIQGSDSASFSNPPAISMTGRRLKITDEPDVPIILSHIAGAGGFTLDTPWTGNTLPTASFKAMKVDYTLSADVQALISPIVIFGMPNQINGMSPERLDTEWPLAMLDLGVPMAFALQNDREVRFSHGGSSKGFQYRLEYRYRPVVTPLTDSLSSIPLVPAQYRQVLADMALTQVFIDKNDDRSNATALQARTLLAAMLKENRRRNKKIDIKVGRIITRPLNTMRRAPRWR